MVTATENCTSIKYHFKVATNQIGESLDLQWVFVDDLDDFNHDIHKYACYTARNPGGGNKEFNVTSIMEARLASSIRVTKYDEYAGRSIDPIIPEWSWIKHFKSLIKIQDSWSDPNSLPYFIRTMTVMKILDPIRDCLWNKLGIRNFPLSHSSIVHCTHHCCF